MTFMLWQISSNLRFLVVLLAVTACSFPRPADVGGDAAGSADADVPTIDAPEDAPDAPGVIVHVSGTGDDANDGLTKPVKTLKRGIGIAAENHQITKIILASGRYSSSAGETFPYTVPSNVTIVGPAGGGAILAGSKAEPGMTVDAGTLQNLELEDFTVAITATGAARLTNIRIRSSTTAVRGETAAKLTVDTVDIAGTAGSCATGIELNGGASLTATDLVTRALGTSLRARDQSTAQLTRMNATSSVACTMGMLSITSTKSFTMSESILDGGFSGVEIGSPRSSTPTQASLTNVTIRNMDGQALGVGNAMGHMTGGALSHTRNGNFSTLGGVWAFSNVTIENSGNGIFVQEASLTMRDCTVSGNRIGIALSVAAKIDFGTTSSLGNNVIRNSLLGLVVEGGIAEPGPIKAVGNTWNPVQGADAQGKYSVGIVLPGPIAGVAGNNFELQDPALSIQL